MPRPRVTTRYVKVKARKKPQRGSQSFSEGYAGPGYRLYMSTPSGELSLLGQYVEEYRETGIPVHELVSQFQEYDCLHSFQIAANHPNFTVELCSLCGLSEKKEKPR